MEYILSLLCDIKFLIYKLMLENLSVIELIWGVFLWYVEGIDVFF